MWIVLWGFSRFRCRPVFERLGCLPLFWHRQLRNKPAYRSALIPIHVGDR